MCGIIGILGQENVAFDLVEALKRLEYRGYDSAGIATLEQGGLTRLRAEGKLKNLEAKLRASPLKGAIGIGHTRWATHGRPVVENAHPHATEHLALVHNGIIENFRVLREELQKKGVVFTSQTDTEVVAHLVSEAISAGKNPQEAVAATLPKLEGAFALAFLFAGHENLIIGARRGAPLAVGHGDMKNGEGSMMLGSDALALAPFTDTITYLEEGDWVVLTREGAQFFDDQNRIVQRKAQKTQAGAFVVDKGNYRHFMLKEIHEQPEVIGRTLSHYIDMANGEVNLPFEVPFDWKTIDRLAITACGTAFLAGHIAKYWFERLAGLSVEIDIASEFRYRAAPLRKGDAMLVISQSGETADSLATLRYAKERANKILALVNVATSTIARESDAVALTLAGPEIGVASTKAFTCQLAVLACLAIAAGRARGVIDAAHEQALVRDLISLPKIINLAFRQEKQIEDIARRLAKVKDVLYLGRGTSYPLALEGALKLKEISYIHAEGYAAGELKHGPIALVDEKLPVIVLAPQDHWFEKTVSNIQEVAARGGRIILIGEQEASAKAGLTPWAEITMPAVSPEFSALVYAIPVQLLAYYTAMVMGKDVDQPRNLAKSVTVE